MAERSPAPSWNSRSSRSAQAQAVSDRTAPSSQLSDLTTSTQTSVTSSLSTSNKHSQHHHDRFSNALSSSKADPTAASNQECSSTTTAGSPSQSTRPLDDAHIATSLDQRPGLRAASGAPAPAHTPGATRQAPSSLTSPPATDSIKSRYIYALS